MSQSLSRKFKSNHFTLLLLKFQYRSGDYNRVITTLLEFLEKTTPEWIASETLDADTYFLLGLAVDYDFPSSETWYLHLFQYTHRALELLLKSDLETSILFKPRSRAMYEFCLTAIRYDQLSALKQIIGLFPDFDVNIQSSAQHHTLITIAVRSSDRIFSYLLSQGGNPVQIGSDIHALYLICITKDASKLKLIDAWRQNHQEVLVPQLEEPLQQNLYRFIEPEW